ncbi:alpha/beta hydrolase family esterase [Corynebacterium confusum]
MGYTLHREELEHQSRTRKYLLIEPDNLPDNPDIVLYFHGSLQSANVSRRFTNGTFDELAEKYGCLVAYPDGVDRHFNDARGILPVTAREENVDDVGFTRALVERLRRDYSAGRVFACGYSNGGQMVLRLLFDAPGLLSATCIFASTLGRGDNHRPSNPDSALQPTPVLLLHGTADPYAPYAGGTAGLDAQRTRGEVTSAGETAARLAELNGSSPSPATSRPYPGVHAETWGGDAPVVLWTMEGLGHVVPSGNEVDPRLGPNTQDFIAAEVAADFFGLAGRAALPGELG